MLDQFMLTNDGNINLVESPMEGESEKEVEENSIEESKIKVDLIEKLIKDEITVSPSKTPYCHHFSAIYLDFFSPPPELS